MKTIFSLVGALFFSTSAWAGSVLFIHPDGAGVSAWQAARFLWAGPDADLAWDKLPYLAVYRGHLGDNLTATSNGGATAHAYGIKSPIAGFGSDGVTDARPVAASGKAESLMHEALAKGLRTALINSGSIIEPGTAAFVASAAKRSEREKITKQVLESGVDFILSGGEEWLLPEGVAGTHAKSGTRTDGINLIENAKKAGYTVVYNREELLAVPANTKKLLGVFSKGNTFNDMTTEDLVRKGLPTYLATAPTLGEMLQKTLDCFGEEKFFVVAEEEGPDNFGNYNNARGVLDSLKRADQAFDVALKFLETHPDTLVITAADSVAGNIDAIGVPNRPEILAQALAGRDPNGAPYGLDLDGSLFIAEPDRAGKRLPFVISWGTRYDSSGGIVVRAAGKGAENVKGSIQNTDIYWIMREALFPGSQETK